MARSGLRQIETPLQGLVGRGSSDPDAVFNALTPALDTTDVEEVLVSWWLDAASVKVRPAVQFSDDGVTWASAATAFGPASTSNEGWNHDTAYRDIFGLGATEALFCRFGLMGNFGD